MNQLCMGKVMSFNPIFIMPLDAYISPGIFNKIDATINSHVSKTITNFNLKDICK